jgi:hypothetical protein
MNVLRDFEHLELLEGAEGPPCPDMPVPERPLAGHQEPRPWLGDLPPLPAAARA